ncbi:MAG: pre-peptidase C-terminal domain-containing protein [Verrucomicrobiae bacterium]|nr:pre-peptidase C-terminal domain-containing protein [Verrucomicrobiae bacterium]
MIPAIFIAPGVSRLLAGMVLVGLPCFVGAQIPLTNGGNHSDAISAAGETDTWTFSAEAGDQIYLRASQTSGGATFAPRIRVFDAGETLIGSVAGSSSSGTSSARLDFISPGTGTFTVRVDSALANGTGNYRVDFLRQPGATTIPPGETGGPLANEARTDGAIALGDLDAWSFDADVGNLVELRIAQLSGGDAFVPRIRIFDPAGNKLAEASGGSASSTSEGRISFRTPTTNTFTVVVDSATAEGTGNYRLHLVKLPASVATPASDTGGPLTSGGNHDGAISVGDLDVWTFEADADDKVFLRAAQTSGGTAFAPRVRVYNEAGILVGSAGGAGNSSASEARLDYVATEVGTYTVVIDSPAPEGTGNYRLFYLKSPGSFITPPGDDGLPLVTGNQDGSTTLGDLDVWSFTGNAADRVTLSFTQLTGGTTYAPRARLFDGNGTLVGYSADTVSGNASTSELKLILPSTGTFNVVLDSVFIGGAGNYRINYLLETGPFTPDPATGTALTNGGNHEGNLGVGAENRRTFEVAAGEHVSLRAGKLTASDGSQGATLRLRVYDPNGGLRNDVSNFYEPAVNFVTEVAGTYTVVVSFATGVTGTYRLHYLKVPGAFIIPGGDEGGPLSRESASDGGITLADMDVSTFEADQGNAITLRLQELTGGGSFSPRLRLYDPTGQLLATHSQATLPQIVFIAADSGSFEVVVDNGLVGGTGTYQLNATGLPEQGKQLRVAPQRDAQQNETLTVNWRSALARYVLHWTATLVDPDSWEDIAVVSDNGLNARITVSVEPGSGYFRLRLPQL